MNKLGLSHAQIAFQGDRVEVKHSNEYEAKNSDRLEEAQDACSLQV